MLSKIDFSKNNGLVPAIAQNFLNNEVLMLAFQNKEALEKSIETGRAHYFSRSRNKIWQKGEESGHIQEIVEIFYDCDLDTILMKVEQKGPACHTNTATCFTGRKFPCVNKKVIEAARKLFEGFISLKREELKTVSGTAKILLEGNKDFIKKKIAEESEEVLGVLDGTHSHKNLTEDTILESAQFFYWSCLLAILEEKSFDEFFANFFQIKNPIFALHKKAKLDLSVFLERDVKELKNKQLKYCKIGDGDLS